MGSSQCDVKAIRPPPRLVLFDLDDTLCDYARARELRLRAAFSLDLAREQLPRDVDRMIAESLSMHPHGADHFHELFRRHGITDPAVADEAVRWYRANRFLGLELFADAVATIAAVRNVRVPGRGNAGRRIGLVTNGPADVQREKIGLLGIESLVDFVLVSGEFGVWKPDLRIFAEALRLGGVEAANAVFVGDSAEHDIAGARNAGIRTIWVNRTNQPWAGGEPRPDYEVSGLTALLPLLTEGS